MTSKQMKDLLNNMAKKTGVNVQILQRNYMMERLLERISLSEYMDNFILKGGILVAAMVGINSRSTMDLDASVKNIQLNRYEIERIFSDLASMDIGDDVSLVIKSIDEIREEFEYSCFRVSLQGTVDKTVIPMKVDISTGDVITPREVKYSFKLILENRTIDIWAYNLETVLAEKMETTVSRNILNTRMRDFYDIKVLYSLMKNDIDIILLKKALKQTAQKRNTENAVRDYGKILNDIMNDPNVKTLWKNFQKKFTYASELEWSDVMNTVMNLFKEVLC
jgi:predicted nucleotidyltransferase component of viral defense system